LRFAAVSADENGIFDINYWLEIGFSGFLLFFCDDEELLPELEMTQEAGSAVISTPS